MPFLHSPDKDVVQALLDLLAGFQEYHEQLIPLVVPLAFKETEVSIQIAALCCLGALLEQESAHWQEYQHLAQASDALPEVRFAAAHTLAWYHPSGASPAVVEALLASVLPPQSCDRLREVCKVLSHLGVPYGFQGLIDALKYGADHWSILDTIRVAEALLDVAFFGGWVQNRYWHRTIGKPLSETSVFFDKDDDPGEELSEQEGSKDEDACFKWDFSFGSGLGNFALSSFGYGTDAMKKLEDSFAQEGPRALSERQRMAIETLLLCEPLWQITQNLPEIYGLPTTRHELEAFLAGK